MAKSKDSLETFRLGGRNRSPQRASKPGRAEEEEAPTKDGTRYALGKHNPRSLGRHAMSGTDTVLAGGWEAKLRKVSRMDRR